MHDQISYYYSFKPNFMSAFFPYMSEICLNETALTMHELFLNKYKSLSNNISSVLRLVLNFILEIILGL